MPDTLSFTLTLWSGLMVTVAVPEAEVVTGGTSFAPESVTVWVYIESDIGPDIEVQPATTPLAPIIASAAIRTRFWGEKLFMIMPPREKYDYRADIMLLVLGESHPKIALAGPAESGSVQSPDFMLLSFITLAQRAI